MNKYLYAYFPWVSSVLVAGLLVGCAIDGDHDSPQSGNADAVHVTADNASLKQTGILYLYNKQNNQVCTFNAAVGRYAFKDDSGKGCPNDTVYTWRIYQGSPGTTLYFNDRPSCNHESEPSYRYRLVGPAGGTVSTPEGVYIPVDHDGSTGVDVIDGVQTYGSGKSGQLKGKLSCINIGP